ncbi:MAG: hypothetical protein ABIJ59_03440 [Pseudomonadota bacterium]
MWTVNLYQEVWKDGAITVNNAYVSPIFCEKCAAKKDFGNIMVAEAFHPQEAQKKNTLADEVVVTVRDLNPPTTTNCAEHALDKVMKNQFFEFPCDGCAKFIKEGEKMRNIKLFQEVWEDNGTTVLDAYMVFVFCEKCAVKKDFDKITVPDKE